MPLPLLSMYKFVIIALIWLFFLRVIRSVWVEVRGVKATREKRGKGVESPSPKPLRQPAIRGGVLGSQEGSDTLTVNDQLDLVIVEGPYKGSRRRFSGDIIVGRSEECAISIQEDSFASGLHARFFVSGGRHYVEDLKSTNGTKLNGSLVSAPVEIARGDRVTVGRTVIEVGGREL